MSDVKLEVSINPPMLWNLNLFAVLNREQLTLGCWCWAKASKALKISGIVTNM